jgi:NADH-quinone oxidoreductase subunit K
MILRQITINCFIFLLGLLGISLNYNNILISLIGIELMLLSCNLNFIMVSIYLNDTYGQIFSVFILTIAASESAIGLAILIVFFKLRGTLEMTKNSSLNG